MKKFKDLFSTKAFRYSSTTTLMTVALIAIIWVLNFVVAIPKWSVDLTGDKRFTVSNESLEYVKNIKKPVKIYYFTSGDKDSATVDNILKQYTAASSQITVEMVNPLSNPALVNKYSNETDTINTGSIVVTCGERSKVVDGNNFYEGNEQTQQTNYTAEKKLTAAISSVISDKEQVLYFLQGHGETEVSSLNYIKQSISEKNYTVKELNLATAQEVPKDASAVVILGPKKDITTTESAKLEKYSDSNGNLLVCLDVGIEIPNLNALLQKYNISAENDIAIENDPNRAGANVAQFIAELQPGSEITAGIGSNSAVAFYEARSFSIAKKEQSGLTVASLAKTSNDKSYGETDFAGGTTARDDKDIPGPLDVVVSAEKLDKSDPTKRSRLVAIGDESFLVDGYLSAGGFYMFMNSLNWISPQEDTFNAPVKTLQDNTIQNVTGVQGILIIGLVLLLPIMIIVAGFIVWLRRRYK